MQVKKSIKIPVHYGTTNTKIGILDSLTSRITYFIRLISALIDENTKLDRTVIRALIKTTEIISRTGLSYGFRDQCIDKVIWTWKSYRKLHKDWEKKVKRSVERGESARDDTEKVKRQKYLDKLLKREPSKPSFEDKTSCRYDYRTGNVEVGKGKFSPLWIRISTLEKNKRIEIPLNPSQYHLNQLKEAEIDDFEIVKRNLLDKYDEIISSLQEAEKWDKLRKLRDKRYNVSVYHDWCLADQTAEFTEESLICVGNTSFRQTQFRGNGMPTGEKPHASA